METGGYEYYIRYKRGQHELRKVLDDDNDEYEIVFTGDYDKCIEKLGQIRAKNFKYDYSA